MGESLAGDRKSIVFAHSSWILRRELNGLEGLKWGRCNDAWVITWDWSSYHTSPTAGLWEIVTCIDPREQRSSSPTRGIPLPNLPGFNLLASGKIPVVLLEIFPIQGPVLPPNEQPHQALKCGAPQVPATSVSSLPVLE